MVKSQFVELITFLQANSNKKVSTILDEAIAIASKKVAERTFYKDGQNNTIACKDYYFKKWMLVDEVEWSTKEKSASGYNQMCKAGLSAWTKQQRDAEKANNLLLTQVASGELAPEDLAVKMQDIEAARTSINLDLLPTMNAYDTLEELLGANGYIVTAEE